MAHKHSVYDTDLHFLIDPITRVITNQAKQKTTVIQFDHNSERFTFEIPRLVDGHDMSLCTKIEIHYLNVAADKSGLNASVYIADDMQLSPESDDVVIFSWLISHNATAYAGSLNFLIRFLCETGEVVDYLWNTSVCQNITVTPGMNNSESTMEDYSDVLQAWEDQLNAKLIDRLEQTVESTEGGGVNVWTMTFGNGEKSELRVRNGKDEVYVGTEEPDDPDVLVWVNPDGDVGSAAIELLKKVYPVGSVYTSAKDTAPSALFGFGEWNQIKDRLLLAAGTRFSSGGAYCVDKLADDYDGYNISKITTTGKAVTISARVSGFYNVAIFGNGTSSEYYRLYNSAFSSGIFSQQKEYTSYLWTIYLNEGDNIVYYTGPALTAMSFNLIQPGEAYGWPADSYATYDCNKMNGVPQLRVGNTITFKDIEVTEADKYTVSCFAGMTVGARVEYIITSQATGAVVQSGTFTEAVMSYPAEGSSGSSTYCKLTELDLSAGCYTITFSVKTGTYVNMNSVLLSRAGEDSLVKVAPVYVWERTQ